MTGEEWWGSIRQAAKDIESARNRLNAVREPLKASGGSGSKNSTSDPTARVSMAEITAQAFLEGLLDELESVILDGYTACNTIGEALGQDAALVMQLYFVEGYTWAETAKRAHVSMRQAFKLRECSLEFTNTMGIARLCIK
ncbi:hypothetical protein [Lancefieldella parvula]|uniref:hypothetical protein n=1 Tax=Lancefieldella parvula TaxID=1382 RepID=UPI0028EA5892|nr:hypothetical protein [Lancefieldella parvula]